MSTDLFSKAEKHLLYLKCLIDGPSNAGKTLSALKLAQGLVKEGGKIAVIDTEGGKSALYADTYTFYMAKMQKPFLPEKYIKAIESCVASGYEVLIIDGLSQEWATLLDEKEKVQGANSFTAWAKITPRHQAFLDTIIQSDIHIVCTVRSKQDFVLEDLNGKKVPVKKGLAPITREGVEYEFDIQFSVDQDHNARITKNRLNSDGKSEVFNDEFYEILNENHGKELRKFLENLESFKIQK